MEQKFIVNPRKAPYGKTTVVSARLPDYLLKQLDQAAQKTGRTRNELLVMCVEFAMNHLEIGTEEE